MVFNFKQNNFLLHIFFHTIIAFLFTILFFVPDLLFKVIHTEYFVLNVKIYKEFAGFFVLNFILLLCTSTKIRYFFYVLFFTFSFSELLHYSFFHSLIMPYEVPMLFEQSEEILDSLQGLLQYMVAPIGIYISVLVGSYFFLRKIEHKLMQVKYFPFIFMLLLLLTGSIIASQRKSPYVFLPKAESTSIKNMYNVLSWSIAKEIPKLLGIHDKLPEFKPYSIQPTSQKNAHTVVVVMGESLSAKYMSLYGFEKETTPKLDKLKSNLQYTWGYSAGVNTDVSVPIFFLLKREPQNNMVFLKAKTNLFTLAKASGYTTHYITTQKLTVLGGFLGSSVDHLLSKKDFTSTTKTYDEVLVKYLKNVDFSKKNFIVLHQRNSHSPYDHQTPATFYKFDFEGLPYKEHMRNSYFNSLLYTDALYDKMIKIIREQEQSGIIFFTSDHSEMMGHKEEEGRFGHSYLGMGDAKVPMIVYQNLKALKSQEVVDLEGVISHYQFGKIIARAIGYNIINPNENGEYYINGVDISGAQGFLSYRKKGKL